MAAMKLAFSTRIKYLQSLRDHTTEEAVRAAVTTAASNIEHSIERYPGTFDLPTATSLIELISDDETLFSESSRRQMIDKVNAKLATEVDHYDDTLLPVGPTIGKQTMLHRENYFTGANWRGLLDDEASQAEVYMQICAVLVRCGFSRPQETFWGVLVATLQWGSNNPEFRSGSSKRCHEADLEIAPFHHPNIYRRTDGVPQTAGRVIGDTSRTVSPSVPGS